MNPIVRSLRDPDIYRKLILCVALISVDLFSKYAARSAGIGFCNTGITYGIDVLEINAISLIVLFLWLGMGIRFFLAKGISSEVLFWGVLLVVSGGLANQIDRVIERCVYDWIPLGLVDITANIADFSISAGVILCILGVLRESLNKSKN